MRRYLVIAALVLGFGIQGARGSSADSSSTPTPQFCTLANGTLAGCLNTPTPTSTATIVPEAQITPFKTMSIGAGAAGPDGTTQYPITITSELACFSLAEPVDVDVLGNASAVALAETFPESAPSTGNHVEVVVDPATFQAHLVLEVLGSAVGPGGIDVKALWPAENVEVLQNVIPPAAATATPTPVPGQATNTPTPTATPGDTPTPTATATPIPSGPTSGVQSCVEPSLMQGLSLNSAGTNAVLYGLTVPGSSCTAGVTYFQAFDFTDFGDRFITGTSHPVSFDGSARTASQYGIVAFPWNEQSMANFGVGTVTCVQDGGTPQTACSAFLIEQQNTQYLASLTPPALDQVLVHLEVAHCPAGSTLAP